MKLSSYRDGKLLYHLTSLKNLPSIISSGLCSRASLKGKFDDVADSEIIVGRGAKTLENMVPFHFFAGNPFDGRVLTDHKNKDFCMIAVPRVLAKENNWKILPKHPLSSAGVSLVDYNDGMDLIDWELMDKRDYKNTDCKLVCMAECLSPNTVPANNFRSIAVKDEKTKKEIEKLLTKNNITNVFVDVNKWYCSIK
ncbi:DarT ssDNA thymidine ADP-ribosyltransferase family protein [Providencia manganoxydans]|uniref:DarT ssDNA thymidine ADP-ribosyltransferase family protein n=1 Tax=Providencia TaxID=586 RepID=UPI0034E5BDB9